METKGISDNFNELTDNVKEYVRLKITEFKLTLVERTSILVSSFMLAIVFFILGLFLTLFLSLAFIYFFRANIGPEWVGALIVAAFYALVAIIAYVQRKKIFINPVITKISSIILEEEDDEEKI
jgi:hypothetical protein